MHHVNTILPNILFLPSNRALHVMSDLTFKIMSGSPGLIIQTYQLLAFHLKRKLFPISKRRIGTDVPQSRGKKEVGTSKREKTSLACLFPFACHQLCLPEFFLISVTLVPCPLTNTNISAFSYTSLLRGKNSLQ